MSGSLILSRRDDGRLEIQRADDEICIDDDLIGDIPSEGDYRLENKVLKIDASNGLVAYALVTHDVDRHCWHAVRTADTGAARE